MMFKRITIVTYGKLIVVWSIGLLMAVVIGGNHTLTGLLIGFVIGGGAGLISLRILGRAIHA